MRAKGGEMFGSHSYGSLVRGGSQKWLAGLASNLVEDFQPIDVCKGETRGKENFSEQFRQQRSPLRRQF